MRDRLHTPAWRGRPINATNREGFAAGPEQSVDGAVAGGGARTPASALATIAEVGLHAEAADVEGSTAAMCIFGGQRSPLAAVFATHPPKEERIDRLVGMA